MTTYADPHHCPECRTALVAGSSRCAECGLDLSGPLAHELFGVLLHADELLGKLRATSAAPSPRQPRAQDLVSAIPWKRARGAEAAPVPAPAPAPPPAPTPAPAPEVRASAVPKVLLGLGALCILVAALVFLAVTWTILGVGGRTATLVGLTLVTGGLTAWVARKELRGATEAIGLVTIGLATLDVIGARNAGWLGEPSDAAFAAFLGGLLVAGGLAGTRGLSRTPVRQFTVGELTAGLGTLLLSLGLADGEWGSPQGRQLVALMVAAAVAAGTWAMVRSGENRFRTAAWTTTLVAVINWLALFMAGLVKLGSHPSTESVWLGFDGWPLLATSFAAVSVSLLRRLPTTVRVWAAGAALVPLGIAVTSPAYDEAVTTRTLAVALAMAGVSALMALAPRPWAAAGLGAALLGSAYLALPSYWLVGLAGARYLDTAEESWSGTAAGRLSPTSLPFEAGEPWLLPVCVLALLAVLGATARLFGAGRELLALQRVPLVAGAVLIASVVAALLLWPVPVWTVLVVILATATGYGVLHLRRGSADAAAATAVALAAALPLSLYDEHLTALALTAALALLLAFHLRSTVAAVVVAAGAAVPAVVASLLWTTGVIAVGAGPWVALTGLFVVSAVALSRAYLGFPSDSRAAVVSVELGALPAALLLAAGGVAVTDEPSVWTAVYLTVTGVAATTMSLLRAERRRVGWLGGALLALATWVRLSDLGVEQPEPYTLPSAIALLVVGWVNLRRNPATSTHKALGPGLVLALVPSLLWLLHDPLGLRAVLLGLACLGLVIAGAQMRLSAPFLHGATVGLLVVLREAAPFIGETVPRWSLIGAAGVLLIGLGITWEQRLREARTVVGYLTRMR